MPGFYADGEYDVAGFIVGGVDRSQVIDGRSISVGDVLIGLPSSGLHTNGYSLVRRVVFDELGLEIDSHVPDLGETVGDALLRPHRSYLRVIQPLLGYRSHQGSRAHYGRRNDRQSPAHSSARNRGSHRPVVVARAGHLPVDWRGRQRARIRPATDAQHGNRAYHRCCARPRERLSAALLEAGEANSVVIGEITAGEPSVHYG